MTHAPPAERLYVAYPFTAIVGQEPMKRALLAAVVDPALHGVLIRGERGTAKSTAVRALTRLLPEQDVVADCPFGCDPDDPGRACGRCFERVQAGETLPRRRRRVPFVGLPVSATEDRVVGSLDLEQAVLHGAQRFRPGVLAEAHRGVLYVDEVNLLPDHLMDLLLDVAAMGVNGVEREGVTFSHPSRFLLVGTMNPEEGDLRPQLTDRFDLSVSVAAEGTAEARAEVLRRRLDYESDPEAFVARHRGQERALADRILQARDRLAAVAVPDWAVAEVCEASTRVGVDGHRAELAALKAARALAALDGTEIHPALLAEAVALAYAHRLRRRPFEPEQEGVVQLEQVVERLRVEARPPRPDRPAPGLPPGKKKRLRSPGVDVAPPEEPGTQVTEVTVDPVGAPGAVDGRLLGLGADAACRLRTPTRARGRHQMARSGDRHGLRVGARPVRGPAQDLALDATLLAAAQRWVAEGPAVPRRVTRSDLRDKIRVRRSGALIAFAVDASGSMRRSRRMVETKGAVLALLRTAYVSRDRVALVAFRGHHAELLLPFTRSVEQARTHLARLPAGGQTPLAEGMRCALQAIREARRREPGDAALLVVISDGKPNWARSGHPVAEAEAMARRLRQERVSLLFLDTDRTWQEPGIGQSLCRLARGRYLPLADLSAGRILQGVAATLEAIRGGAGPGPPGDPGR